MTGPGTTDFELTVIGTGMAGMAATLFAVNRGVSVAQVGTTSSIVFASGLLDLLGVYPVKEKKVWQDPWAGIEALSKHQTNHPYARMKRNDIRTAFDEMLTFLEKAGLLYRRHPHKNSEILTSLGTTKLTYCVP